MQVAFYLAGEITQVKESIPGVRCASGNVFFLGGFPIFPPGPKPPGQKGLLEGKYLVSQIFATLCSDRWVPSDFWFGCSAESDFWCHRDETPKRPLLCLQCYSRLHIDEDPIPGLEPFIEGDPSHTQTCRVISRIPNIRRYCLARGLAYNHYYSNENDYT